MPYPNVRGIATEEPGSRGYYEYLQAAANTGGINILPPEEALPLIEKGYSLDDLIAASRDRQSESGAIPRIRGMLRGHENIVPQSEQIIGSGLGNGQRTAPSDERYPRLRRIYESLVQSRNPGR